VGSAQGGFVLRLEQDHLVLDSAPVDVQFAVKSQNFGISPFRVVKLAEANQTPLMPIIFN
jgi:hypothetical protein